jgi:hypothetical protein
MDAALAELEPNAMIGAQPAAGIELITGHERACAAARTRLTARAAEMNHWQRLGFRSFEDWLAATTGTSPGQARRKTRAAKNMADNDDITDALADGAISEDEADVVADAAAKNPEAEKELLDTAKNPGRSHKDLKDRAAKAKAAGEDDHTRAERLRKGRTAGWGPDREGFWGRTGRFQPHVGAEIKACLQAEVDRRFNQARRAGLRQPRAWYRADALAGLILGREPDTGDPDPDPDPGNSNGGGNGSGDPGTGQEPTGANGGHGASRERTDDHGPAGAAPDDRADGTRATSRPIGRSSSDGRQDSDRDGEFSDQVGGGRRGIDGEGRGGEPQLDFGPDTPTDGADGQRQNRPSRPDSTAGTTTPTGEDSCYRAAPDGPAPPRKPNPQAATAGAGRVGKELILDINLEALRRGCVNPGETCHIRGIGPVPVEIARRWADDAFIKAVIRDGVDVKKVPTTAATSPPTS